MAERLDDASSQGPTGAPLDVIWPAAVFGETFREKFLGQHETIDLYISHLQSAHPNLLLHEIIDTIDFEAMRPWFSAMKAHALTGEERTRLQHSRVLQHLFGPKTSDSYPSITRSTTLPYATVPCDLFALGPRSQDAAF